MASLPGSGHLAAATTQRHLMGTVSYDFLLAAGTPDFERARLRRLPSAFPMEDVSIGGVREPRFMELS